MIYSERLKTLQIVQTVTHKIQKAFLHVKFLPILYTSVKPEILKQSSWLRNNSSYVKILRMRTLISESFPASLTDIAL